MRALKDGDITEDLTPLFLRFVGLNFGTYCKGRVFHSLAFSGFLILRAGVWRLFVSLFMKADYGIPR